MSETSALTTSQRLVSLLETFSRGGATVEELEYAAELLIAASEEEAAASDRKTLVAALVEVLIVLEFLHTAQVFAVAEDAAIVLRGDVRNSDGNQDSHTSEGNRLRQKRLETKFAIGKDCFAVLEEDNAWHPARIRKHIHESDSDCDREVATVGNDDDRLIQLEVEFLEFGKRQIVCAMDVVLDENVADREEAEDMKGLCAMCERPMSLTAHHVIPRVTHSKYLRRGYTKEFLNTCIMICRQCHSKVHSIEDNATLAREYHTLDKIMQHPQIIAWVAFARKQKARIKPQKQAKWVVRK